MKNVEKWEHFGARNGRRMPRLAYILNFAFPLALFAIAGMIILALELFT
jgi:hypothetical protein